MSDNKENTKENLNEIEGNTSRKHKKCLNEVTDGRPSISPIQQETEKVLICEG